MSNPWKLLIALTLACSDLSLLDTFEASKKEDGQYDMSKFLNLLEEQHPEYFNLDKISEAIEKLKSEQN